MSESWRTESKLSRLKTASLTGLLFSSVKIPVEFGVQGVFFSWLVQLLEWRAERIHLEEQSQEKVAELQQNISALQTEGGRLQERVVSFTGRVTSCCSASVTVATLPSFLPLTGSSGRAEDGGRNSYEATETRTTAVQGNNN